MNPLDFIDEDLREGGGDDPNADQVTNLLLVQLLREIKKLTKKLGK